jgi:hypothetical protein
MPRPSPPHGHPPNINLPSYNNFGRHEYHHQPPRHPVNLPPHFNERPVRPFSIYSPPHGGPRRQAEDHLGQYPVGRRGPPPPLSPRAESASGPEGPQHIHAPHPPNIRRTPQYPYGQGFYEYGEYGRSISASGSHSPTMRSSNRVEGEVVRRFVPRPMPPQDRQHMMASESRQMGQSREHREHMGPSDPAGRLQENWRGSDGYDNDYGPNRHSPQDEEILPRPPTIQQSPQFRGSNSDRVFRTPQGVRVGNSFDLQSSQRHMSFDRTPSKSENTDDEQSSGIRSNDENSSPAKDDISSNVGCTCKKSKCLKLYCQCFASSAMCVATCRCINCKNIPKHEIERNDAIRSIMMRNPNAFDTKFKATAEGKSSKVTHKLGCKCRKSACLKKYCECYHAEVKCSTNCRCTGCQNMPTSGPPDMTQRQRQSNYVPVAMIDAARDLAGLKNGSPSKHSAAQVASSARISESPARATNGSQDLYLVPSLTTSDTQSKEDDSFTDDHKSHISDRSSHAGQLPQMRNKTNGGLSNNRESSSVDVLLSAAYALTELQGSSHAPATPSSGKNTSPIISPSPKRKMSDINHQSNTRDEEPFRDRTPMKKRICKMVTPVTSKVTEFHRMEMNSASFRERLNDDIESESA